MNRYFYISWGGTLSNGTTSMSWACVELNGAFPTLKELKQLSKDRYGYSDDVVVISISELAKSDYEILQSQQ